MKTIKTLSILIAGIFLLITCSESDYFTNVDPLPLGETLKNGNENPSTEPVMVTVPFKVNLTVWNYSEPDDRCEPNVFLTMRGNGVVAHLGNMTTEMTFCADISHFPVGPYGPGTGVFIAANGDELNFEFDDGEIVWNEGNNAAYYPTTFNDKMYFTGGTGRFEEASGDFKSNAFVHFADDDDPIWHTDFFSEGTLTLIKGKR